MSDTKTKLQFWGGAGSVTGSNFMLDSDGVKIMIDCGMFQGCEFCEDSNFAALPYNPADVSTLIVTHAHIDHIGRIPRLMREGFKGRIISTEATKALAHPLLLDAMKLLAHTAEMTGKPQLYDSADVERSMAVWDTHPYHESFSLAGGFTAELLDAGHILGSAMVRIARGGRTIIFTGDLGNDESLLVGPTESIAGANYLVTESVYGDKKHDHIENRTQEFERVVEQTLAKGGVLLIPAFSTERTQDLLFELRTLLMEKRIPSIPVYLDSPLASRITEAFSANPSYFRDTIRKRIEGGEHIFSFPELHFIHDAQESAQLHKDESPKIIIAGSGMSHGGRVLGHEAFYLSDPKNTLLIVGYQAAGSLGRALIEGQKNVSIMKQKVTVRASVEKIYGYSAHRDADGLLSFVEGGGKSLTEVFVAMGEPKSSLFLVQRIRDFLGIKASAPEQGTEVVVSL